MKVLDCQGIHVPHSLIWYWLLRTTITLLTSMQSCLPTMPSNYQRQIAVGPVTKTTLFPAKKHSRWR